MNANKLKLGLVLTMVLFIILPAFELKASASEVSFADSHTMQYIEDFEQIPPLPIGVTMKDAKGTPCSTTGFTPLMLATSNDVYSYSHFILDECTLLPSTAHENYQTITVKYSAIQNIFIDCNWDYTDNFESFSWTYKPLNLMDLKTGVNLPFIKDAELPAELSRPSGNAKIYYKETYDTVGKHTFSVHQKSDSYDGGIYLYKAITGFTITIDVPNNFDVTSLAFYVAKAGASEYIPPSPNASNLTIESYTTFTANVMDTKDYYFIKMFDVFN